MSELCRSHCLAYSNCVKNLPDITSEASSSPEGARTLRFAQNLMSQSVNCEAVLVVESEPTYPDNCIMMQLAYSDVVAAMSAEQ